MLKNSLILGALALLTACGDPLGGVPRISDVELAENDPAAQALPTEAEVAREGFFGTDAATAEPTALTEAPAATPEPPQPRGLLGLLRRAVPAAQRDPIVPASAAPVAEAFEAAEAGVAPSEPETETASAPVELAALPDDAPATAPVGVVPKRQGFFGRLLSNSPGSAATGPAESALLDVDYDTVLPYGVVARACAAKRQRLGRKVESASASGFKLYDSNPRATGLRTFYITGFDDGCPRQVTAAHVLFGSPSFYELLHYGPAGAHLTVGETDRAYEKVKGQVCGVRKGKPCGSKMNRLERNTVFLNTYPRADDNTSWSEVLFHGGEVMATSMKDNG